MSIVMVTGVDKSAFFPSMLKSISNATGFTASYNTGLIVTSSVKSEMDNCASLLSSVNEFSNPLNDTESLLITDVVTSGAFTISSALIPNSYSL